MGEGLDTDALFGELVDRPARAFLQIARTMGGSDRAVAHAVVEALPQLLSTLSHCIVRSSQEELGVASNPPEAIIALIANTVPGIADMLAIDMVEFGEVLAAAICERVHALAADRHGPAAGPRSSARQEAARH